jgi:hypothetical protein
MEKKTAYLVINGKDIKIENNIEDIQKLEFENEDQIKNLNIFEIEFKSSVNFKTKVKLKIEK